MHPDRRRQLLQAKGYSQRIINMVEQCAPSKADEWTAELVSKPSTFVNNMNKEAAIVYKE